MFIKSAAVAASAALLLGAGAASAASIAPLSYTFDQSTDCGTYCYRDAGTLTPFFTAEPSTPYGELTDGVTGYAGWEVDGAAPWVGWTDSVVNIDFTFDGEFHFSSVKVGSTQDNLNDVVLPNLRVFAFEDGSGWVLKGAKSTTPSEANSTPNTFSMASHVFLTVGGLDFNASRVRLEVSNQGVGYGGFSFLDEVSFSDGAGVPEPGAWALMIAGFGMAGAVLRRRRQMAV